MKTVNVNTIAQWRCDRCGNKFTFAACSDGSPLFPGNTVTNDGINDWRTVKTVWTSEPGGTYTETDLCPMCAGAFKMFMEGGR